MTAFMISDVTCHGIHGTAFCGLGNRVIGVPMNHFGRIQAPRRTDRKTLSATARLPSSVAMSTALFPSPATITRRPVRSTGSRGLR